jgi:23S rRNA G2069 N7-methylase RlmK/C1962 C5-methylase RlmI
MLKIQVTGIQQAVAGIEKEKSQFIARVANVVKDVAVRKTPIDKGRARRGWRIERGPNPSVAGQAIEETTNIVNRVPYIVALEDGHSKQAPNGILGPTMREISKRRIT